MSDEFHGPHAVPIPALLGVFLALIVLTAITTTVAYVDLGAWNVVVMLGIAVTKATLVVLFFMEVHWSPRLTKLLVGSSFAWLLILFAFTLADIVTRYGLVG